MKAVGSSIMFATTELPWFHNHMEQRHNEFYEINQVTATYNGQDNVTLPLVIWIIREIV